ncbi:MAG: hypothetical protein QM270_07595, partial [Bacillota bacterium]|nr:hypothetical protein [Bacillota bacterium]
VMSSRHSARVRSCFMGNLLTLFASDYGYRKPISRCRFLSAYVQIEYLSEKPPLGPDFVHYFRLCAPKTLTT